MSVRPIEHPLEGERVVGLQPETADAAREWWPRRLHCHTGRTLTATALTNEQEHRARRLTALACSLTPGVIEGLEVSVEDDLAALDAHHAPQWVPHIVVQPGSALTAAGQDVRVSQVLRVPLRTLLVNALPQGDAPAPARAPRPAERLPPPAPRHGVLLLKPVRYEDQGQGDALIRDDIASDPCARDPELEPFSDLQVVDGCLLTWAPLSLPGLFPLNPRRRNELAWSLFDREQDGGPLWPDATPIALIEVLGDTVVFIDRAAVVRRGGGPMRRERESDNPRLLAQIDQLTGELFDVDGDLASLHAEDRFRYLPPFGLLPRELVDLEHHSTHFFPAGFKLTLAPIPLEQLDVVARAAAELAPIHVDAALEEIRVLVPVPQQLYDPHLLKTETLDPAFDTILEGFVKRRGTLLGRREVVRRRLSALLQAIGGPSAAPIWASPDPGALEPEGTRGVGDIAPLIMTIQAGELSPTDPLVIQLLATAITGNGETAVLIVKSLDQSQQTPVVEVVLGEQAGVKQTRGVHLSGTSLVDVCGRAHPPLKELRFPTFYPLHGEPTFSRLVAALGRPQHLGPAVAVVTRPPQTEGLALKLVALPSRRSELAGALEGLVGPAEVKALLDAAQAGDAPTVRDGIPDRKTAVRWAEALNDAGAEVEVRERAIARMAVGLDGLARWTDPVPYLEPIRTYPGAEEYLERPADTEPLRRRYDVVLEEGYGRERSMLKKAPMVQEREEPEALSLEDTLLMLTGRLPATVAPGLTLARGLTEEEARRAAQAFERSEGVTTRLVPSSMLDSAPVTRALLLVADVRSPERVAETLAPWSFGGMAHVEQLAEAFKHARDREVCVAALYEPTLARSLARYLQDRFGARVRVVWDPLQEVEHRIVLTGVRSADAPILKALYEAGLTEDQAQAAINAVKQGEEPRVYWDSPAGGLDLGRTLTGLGARVAAESWTLGKALADKPAWTLVLPPGTDVEDRLDDIAVLVGATGARDGSARGLRPVPGAVELTDPGGDNDAIAARREQVEQLADASDDEDEKARLNGRVATLTLDSVTLTLTDPEQVELATLTIELLKALRTTPEDLPQSLLDQLPDPTGEDAFGTVLTTRGVEAVALLELEAALSGADSVLSKKDLAMLRTLGVAGFIERMERRIQAAASSLSLSALQVQTLVVRVHSTIAELAKATPAPQQAEHVQLYTFKSAAPPMMQAVAQADLQQTMGLGMGVTDAPFKEILGPQAIFQGSTLVEAPLQAKLEVDGGPTVLDLPTVSAIQATPVPEALLGQARSAWMEILRHIALLGVKLTDVKLPGFQQIDPDGNHTLIEVAVVTETPEGEQIPNDTLLAQIAAGDHDNPFSDNDAPGMLQHALALFDTIFVSLKRVEARLVQIGIVVERAREALATLRAYEAEARQRLAVLETELAEARHDVAAARALRAEELRRIDDVNLRRARILAEEVPFLAFHRPRVLEAVVSTPVRTVLPGLVRSPVLACLESPLPAPPALNALVDLWREAPARWLGVGAGLLDSLNQVTPLTQILTQAQARGLASVAAPVSLISGVESFQKVLKIGKSALQPVHEAAASLSLGAGSWKQLRAKADDVVTLGDLIEGARVSALVAEGAARALEQLRRVVAGLHRELKAVPPRIRLDWSHRLSQFDQPVDLSEPSRLPRWGEIDDLARQEIQALVDWLFDRLADGPTARGLMSDTVRGALLLAAHAPVDRIIAGHLPAPTPLLPGTLIPVVVDLGQIHVGMQTLLYAKGEVVGHGKVADIADGKAITQVISATATSTTLEAGAKVQFVAEGGPTALGALKTDPLPGNATFTPLGSFK
ncbi:MAG: hypothetical protein H6739_35330 [Alphaproteobacteria bacterium]|nr:hypothetical protein [Alphaproteobacteria bacterium]